VQVRRSNLNNREEKKQNIYLATINLPTGHKSITGVAEYITQEATFKVDLPADQNADHSALANQSSEATEQVRRL
jgi:hypothetical protein